MILIKNVDVYSPEHLGVQDILVCGDKIECVADNIDIDKEYTIVVDATGHRAIPGIIDQHVHVTGGGGEGGFSTRAPELELGDMIESGITTVVGLLGTDASTRSVENLLAKTKAINEQGFTAFCLTGSYEFPSPTITGSVRSDIVFIQEIIGCKIAIADHRSSQMTDEELVRLASEVKVAGMLSGKPQILIVHMGAGKRGLQQIFGVIDDSDLPINVFSPTHFNRSKRLVEESLILAARGGYVDFTCGLDIPDSARPSHIVKTAQDADVPLDKMTFSSDGYGSFSTYDEEGNLESIGIATLGALFNELKYMVNEAGFELGEALPFMTTNVAAGLNLAGVKGKIESGYDADLLILDEGFEIDTFVAKGKVLKRNGKIAVRFPFE